MTVGLNVTEVGAVRIAGTRPVPVSATPTLGLAGSLVASVRVALRGPAAVGLNRTVTLTELPDAMVSGRLGPPTTVKSAEAAPPIVSALSVMSQLPVFDSVTFLSFEDGLVRLSVAMPPKSSDVVLSDSTA